MELPKNDLDRILDKIDQGDFAALRADAQEFLKFASEISVDRPASLRYGDSTLKVSASLKGIDIRQQPDRSDSSLKIS